LGTPAAIRRDARRRAVHDASTQSSRGPDLKACRYQNPNLGRGRVCDGYGSAVRPTGMLPGAWCLVPGSGTAPDVDSARVIAPRASMRPSKLRISACVAIRPSFETSATPDSRDDNARLATRGSANRVLVSPSDLNARFAAPEVRESGVIVTRNRCYGPASASVERLTRGKHDFRLPGDDLGPVNDIDTSRQIERRSITPAVRVNGKLTPRRHRRTRIAQPARELSPRPTSKRPERTPEASCGATPTSWPDDHT
jgi:hypothetical protein